MKRLDVPNKHSNQLRNEFEIDFVIAIRSTSAWVGRRWRHAGKKKTMLQLLAPHETLTVVLIYRKRVGDVLSVAHFGSNAAEWPGLNQMAGRQTKLLRN